MDGENVRRSQWPNLSQEELVARVEAWARREGHEATVVFDGAAPAGAVGSGAESADDRIAREAAALEGYWLVTSDRGLRARAGGRAARVVGGGAFLELLR